MKMACNMILRLSMTMVCASTISVSAIGIDKLASARGGDESPIKHTVAPNQIALDSFINVAPGYLCHCNLAECIRNGYACRTQRGCFFEIQNTIVAAPKPGSPLETIVGIEESDKLELTNADSPVTTGCMELSPATNVNCEFMINGQQAEFPAMTKPIMGGGDIKTYYKCCADAMCNDQQHVEEFIQNVRHSQLPFLNVVY